MQQRAGWTGSRSGRLWATLATTALMATGVQAGSAAPEPDPGPEVRLGQQQVPDEPPTGPTTYIVQMALDPVTSYTGGQAGLSATRPDQGQKVDPTAPAVTAYADHLRGRQRAALAAVGGGEPEQQYVFAFDGFSAELTSQEAADLSAQPGVLAVTPDEYVETTTATTPSFLGLDDSGGLWEQLGGPAGSLHVPGAGGDMVIGVIDSGIWPDAQSFSDRDGNGKLVYKPLNFDGQCESEETVGDDSWDANLCNKKLVGARHFNEGWGGDEGVAEQLPWEFLSPRDYNGHGTHTAATAAGNHGVDVTGPAAALGPVSGVAPRARIAAYKALWSTEDGSTAGGYNSDIVAAVDQAVADGVDVINFSVSGTSTNLLDPVELSFMNAAAAGIFVAASAGNDGPASGTVAHPSPWVTTVAAGTHNRSLNGTVTLGDSTALTGASAASESVGSAPFIDATAAGAEGADATKVAQCHAAVDNDGEPVLDPAVVSGKIVLCDRGETPRVNKSRAVAEAGGIGMVLVNVGEDNLVADFHSVPSVHLPDSDRAAVKAYAGTDGATASIAKAEVRSDGEAPFVADFSSRGPLTAGGGDLLKPDLIAPGQDILAAVAPPAHGGAEFNLLSGTSMSAPHVAGLAALLSDRHPGWSPMMIKSALMTTGYDVVDGDPTDPGTIYGQGAGHVAPNTAVDPGLVYESDQQDWLAFLCGATTGVEPQACSDLEEDGRSLEPTDLNLASIAIGRVSGTQTVTREVTNVSDVSSTYTAQTTGLSGLGVTVEPNTLTLQPGESASFTVTLSAPEGTQTGTLAGQLIWSDGTHEVRSPIVVQGSRNGTESWEARFNGSATAYGEADDTAYDMAVTADGERLIVAGNSYPAGPGTLRPDYITAAYDPATGDELWSQTYDGPLQGADELSGFGLSPDGEVVFVTGGSSGEGTGSDFVTIAYDSVTGEQLWLTRFDATGQSDNPGALTVSPDGQTVFVSGLSRQEETADYATIAYDATTGEQKWIAVYDGPGHGTEDTRDIAVSPDGSTLVITGQSRGLDGGLTDIGTVAYAAETGEELWADHFDGPRHGIDVGSSVLISDSGVVYVSGSYSAVSTDWVLIAYDGASGERQWTSTYDGEGQSTDVPRDMAMAPNGETIVVVGNSWGDGTNSDYATVAFDSATGEQRWAARHDGSASSLDIGLAVTVTPDSGHVVVTGRSMSSQQRNDYETMAYAMGSGEQVWSANYDAGSGTDMGTAITSDVTDDGVLRIFVSGQSSISEGFFESDADMTTLAYLDPLPTP